MNRAILTTLTGLVAALAAIPASATPPELACGRFALTEPLALPRNALVLRTIAVGADAVVLNGTCVSRRARIHRRANGSVRFVAIVGDCGQARGVKVRARIDEGCSILRGRLVARRPPFRARFEAVPISDHECGTTDACAPGTFCELPPGECALDSTRGICVPIPDGCPAVVDPVCGCDGVTYGNDCEAAAAGVNVAHDGACEPRCGGIAGLGCPDGFVCDLDPGMCGASDLQGVCVPRPQGCPEVYAPVCGCDGVTYGNDCERVAAGVQKDRDGPCECPDILCPPDTIPVDTDRDGCVDACISARCETNADCPDDRWCADPFGIGDCAGPGICQERPLGCPDVWLPICGCDGLTYSNECDAAAAGTRIAHEGECLCEPPICPDGTPPVDTDGDGCPDRCPPGGVCGTIVGIPCPDGEVCDLEPGSCEAADTAGVCVPKPEACLDIYLPVCGCDGLTYGNDCERVLAGVTKAHDGECGACRKCPDGFFPIPGPDGCPIACIGPPCETTCTGTTCTIVCTGVEPS